MPSLPECVLSQLERSSVPNDEEESGTIDLFAHYDLDIDAISTVEGSWEPVDVVDPTQPHVDGIPDDAFTVEGPSVFKVDDYIVVRGREDVHHAFFVFEPTL